MLKRLAFFFALFLPAGAFAQVQYEIVSVPVCWNDSSLIKYTYVTTSGAYLDLGYFSPSGAPITVSGGTLRTGFCPGQTLSIDSTANRTFTITLGDQTVSWVDSVGSGTGGGGASDLGALTDVDTTGKANGYVLAYNSATSTWEAQDNNLSIDSTGRAFTIALGGQDVSFEDQVGLTSVRLADVVDVDTTGETTGSIILYDATSGNWEAQANSIDNLTDGYEDANNNIFLFNPPFNEITGSDNAGILSLYRLKTGFENTGFGNYSGLQYTTGSQNDIFGFFASPQDTSGNRSTFLGSYTNIHPYSPVQSGIGKVKADESIFIGHRARGLNDTSKYEITIGAFSIGKGDSTVILGLPFYKGTYLNGNLNLNGYGLGNKEATDLTKTQSAYIAAFATDGTLLELDTTGLYASGATTLNGLTDVVLTSPQINDVLKYNGTNWVNDTLTISGGGGVLSVTANNGLTNTGTASQPVIELGGTLSKATTTISANFKNLVINRPLNFEVDSVYLARIGTQDGLSTSSKLQIGAAANSWQSVNNDDDLTNRIELYSSLPTQGAKISSYQNANNAVFTQIELLPQQMQIVTPNVNTLTATAGQVLKLVDPSTGEVEFASDSTGATTLSGLTDVSIGTPTTGEVLIYNGTAWVNDTLSVSGGGFTLPTDSITFNDNNGDAVAGKLQYNTDYGTLVFGAQNNTPIHIGSDMGWYVKNQTGSPIAKGVPVYASGTDGASGRITVAPMIANNSLPAKFFLGVTAEAIANGADGFVWSHGKIKPLNLSAFTAGDVLYVSPTTAGTFTATEPTAPNLKLPVGFVVNNSATGTLAVRATIGNYLSEAHDVQLTTPSNGQALKYDGTKWVNGSDLVNDADADPTNELQDLSLSGNTLSLSGDATTVDLSGFLRDTLASDVTITGNTNDYLFNSIDNFEVNLTGNKTLFLGHPKMYIDFSAVEMKLYASDQPINLSSPAGIKFENYGSGTKEAGDFTPIKTASAYLANFATDGTLIDFPISTFVTSASNGLTKQGNNLILGGTLTSPTTITLGSGNAFTISGTNTGLVVNQTTGIVGLGGTVTTTNYGLNNMEASDLGKTFSGNYAGFADDGTVIEVNALPISTGTSGAISWANLPQRIHVLDFGANTSITLSFSNVRVGGIYTLRVTGNSGTDTLVWPGTAKFEDGTSAGTVTLQDGGQMFTFYWDGTNYWVK